MKLLFALLISLAPILGHCQVSWSFRAEKIVDRIYDVHMIAQIDPGWHIHSQHQNKKTTVLPTMFLMEYNLRIKHMKIEEYGYLIKAIDTVLCDTSSYYENLVEFVDRLVLKTPGSFILTGHIYCQMCKQDMCLAPKDITFTVKLN